MACRSCRRHPSRSSNSWTTPGWHRTRSSVRCRPVRWSSPPSTSPSTPSWRAAKAEYMPVVVAAVRAHLHEKANCHSTTGTLSGAAQVVIVNGPVRRRARHQLRRPAASDRAGGPTPPSAGRCAWSFATSAGPFRISSTGPPSPRPARYTFCFGEDEEGSDWVPMHVERGFALGTSAVTVALDDDHGLGEETSSARTPEGIWTRVIAATIRSARAPPATVARRRHQRGRGDRPGTPALVHLAAGWSKADIRAAMWPLLKAPPAGGRAARSSSATPKAC